MNEKRFQPERQKANPQTNPISVANKEDMRKASAAANPQKGLEEDDGAARNNSPVKAATHQPRGRSVCLHCKSVPSSEEIGEKSLSIDGIPLFKKQL